MIYEEATDQAIQRLRENKKRGREEREIHNKITLKIFLSAFSHILFSCVVSRLSFLIWDAAVSTITFSIIQKLKNGIPRSEEDDDGDGEEDDDDVASPRGFLLY